MCYSVAYLERKQSRLIERYKNLLPPEWKDLSHPKKMDELPAYYFISAFVHPDLPIITGEGIRLMEWGLIPFWVKGEEKAAKIRKGTLNAVGETIFTKPSFRGIIRSRRGILPISGFFEWRDHQGKKYPYFIRLKDQGLFSLACVYDSWTNRQSGEIIDSFSLITTPANPMMEVVHNRKKRMPLILPLEKEKEWIDNQLDEQEILQLIQPFDAGRMEAYPVSRRLNYAGNDRNTPEAIREHNYPELPVIQS